MNFVYLLQKMLLPIVMCASEPMDRQAFENLKEEVGVFANSLKTRLEKGLELFKESSTYGKNTFDSLTQELVDKLTDKKDTPNQDIPDINENKEKYKKFYEDISNNFGQLIGIVTNFIDELNTEEALNDALKFRTIYTALIEWLQKTTSSELSYYKLLTSILENIEYSGKFEDIKEKFVGLKDITTSMNPKDYLDSVINSGTDFDSQFRNNNKKFFSFNLRSSVSEAGPSTSN